MGQMTTALPVIMPINMNRKKMRTPLQWPCIGNTENHLAWHAATMSFDDIHSDNGNEEGLDSCQFNLGGGEQAA